MWIEGTQPIFKRKIAIYEILRTHREPVAIIDLARRFKVSDDTIRRDLRDIEGTGCTITYSRDDDNDGRTVVHLPSKAFVSVAFTRSEAHLFAGMRRLWAPFRGLSLYEDMESIFKKILESLPPEDRRALQADCGRFFFIPDGGVRNFEGKREVVRTLQKAVVASRLVEYKYRALSGRVFSGKLEAYALVVYRNTVYVRARRLQSDRSAKAGKAHDLEWVSWPADRFSKVTLLRETFKVPDDFDIESHFDGFGIVQGERRERVVVEFSPAVAAQLRERSWHRTQKMTVLPDGWVRIEFETANLMEARNWIQSYGPQAVVVEPVALRDAILDGYRQALEVANARALGRANSPDAAAHTGIAAAAPAAA